MNKILKMEFKRLFKSKSFYFSIFVGMAISIWSLIESLRIQSETLSYGEEFIKKKFGAQYYPLSLYSEYIGLNPGYIQHTLLFFILPVLVALPLGASYYFDRKNGYLKNVLINVSKKDYYISKYIAVFCSGAIVTISILGLSLLMCALFFPALPPMIVTNTFAPSFRSDATFLSIYLSHPLLYICIYTMVDAIFYGLTATIALTISCFIKNSLVAITGPFLIYLSIEYIVNVFNYKFLFISPNSFLLPSQFNCVPNFYVIAIESIFILIITIVLFIYKERKKDVL